MTKTNFDMDAALKQLREGQDLTGKDGILTPLIKQLTEAAMQAELDEHLSDKEQSNRKNGSTSKSVKSPAGSFELDTPRDRAGSFEPQLVKKHQTHLTDELERKIIALFSLGTSYQDIRMHIEDLYGIHVSNSTINAVTDKLLPELLGFYLSEHWSSPAEQQHHPYHHHDDSVSLSDKVMLTLCGGSVLWLAGGMVCYALL